MTADVVIQLQTGWQGGPAAIGLDVDELDLDEGIGLGVLLTVKTPCDPDGELRVALGCGDLTVPMRSTDAPARLEFTVAASLDQACELRDALTRLLDEATTP